MMDVSSRDEVERAAHAMVDAWERLPGGRRYSVSEVQRWMSEDMKPAIDNLRRVLGRKIPTA